MATASLDRQTAPFAPLAVDGHGDGDVSMSPWRDVAGWQWIARFTVELKQEGRVSASTLTAYALDLSMIIRWATPRQQALLALSAADLEQYVIERLAAGAHRSTVARHLSSCRRFYAYLASHGVIAGNPASSVLVKRLPVPATRGPLQDDLLQALLRTPHQPEDPGAAAFRAQRDHAIVCMLHGAPLRVSQVRLLRWQQIDVSRCAVEIVGRGGVPGIVRLDPRLVALLGELRRSLLAAAFDFLDTPYCFPTASGGPLTRQGLCQVVHRWSATHGNARSITPSVLRQAGQARGAAPRQARPMLAGVQAGAR
jgi:site-specific recombinase XerD